MYRVIVLLIHGAEYLCVQYTFFTCVSFWHALAAGISILWYQAGPAVSYRIVIVSYVWASWTWTELKFAVVFIFIPSVTELHHQHSTTVAATCHDDVILTTSLKVTWLMMTYLTIAGCSSWSRVLTLQNHENQPWVNNRKTAVITPWLYTTDKFF